MATTINTKLREAAEAGELVVFIGSGMSCNYSNKESEEIGIPKPIGLWEGLVECLIKSLGEDDDRIQKYSEIWKNHEAYFFLSIIENYINRNNPGLESNAKKYLADYYDLSDENDFSIYREIHELSDIIITTNYDEAIENANRSLAVITCGDESEMQNLLKSSKGGLVKLHGSISKPDEMVVFPKDYDELYDKLKQTENYDKFIYHFNRIINERTFLFLGCGMGDFQINHLFQVISPKFKGEKKHFYVTRKDTIEKELRGFLEIIQVGNYDSDIRNLIKQLIAIKRKGTNQRLSDKNYYQTEVCVTIELVKEKDEYTWRHIIESILKYESKSKSNIKIATWTTRAGDCLDGFNKIDSTITVNANKEDGKEMEHDIRKDANTEKYVAYHICPKNSKKKFPRKSTVKYRLEATAKQFNHIFDEDKKDNDNSWDDEYGNKYLNNDGFVIYAGTGKLSITLKFDESYDIKLDDISPYVSAEPDTAEHSDSYEMCKIKDSTNIYTTGGYKTISFSIEEPKMDYAYGFLWNPIKKP